MRRWPELRSAMRGLGEHIHFFTGFSLGILDPLGSSAFFLCEWLFVDLNGKASAQGLET